MNAMNLEMHISRASAVVLICVLESKVNKFIEENRTWELAKKTF